jgi:hypothetical protein
MDVSPEQSSGLIAAWQGVYHLFNGRVDSWEVTPDGLVAHGFTVDGNYDPEVVLRDVNRKDRRTQLFPAINYINGQEPDGFATPQDLTTYATQYFRGSQDEGTTRSPKYLLGAMASYRTNVGIGGRRGPKPKAISLKNLGSVDPLIFKDINPADLNSFKEILNTAIKSQAEAAIAAE